MNAIVITIEIISWELHLHGDPRVSSQYHVSCTIRIYTTGRETFFREIKKISCPNDGWHTTVLYTVDYLSRGGLATCLWLTSWIGESHDQLFVLELTARQFDSRIHIIEWMMGTGSLSTYQHHFTSHKAEYRYDFPWPKKMLHRTR